MKGMRFWPYALTLTALVFTAVPSRADDARKAEHDVSGVGHRISKAYHKQVKDYHLRQARRARRHGQYVEAARQVHKARWHSAAEQRQLRRAHRQERATRNE